MLPPKEARKQDRNKFGQQLTQRALPLLLAKGSAEKQSKEVRLSTLARKTKNAHILSLQPFTQSCAATMAGMTMMLIKGLMF